jgi:hypothetical protein
MIEMIDQIRAILFSFLYLHNQKRLEGNLRDIIHVNRHYFTLFKRTDVAEDSVIVALGHVKFCNGAWRVHFFQIF